MEKVAVLNVVGLTPALLGNAMPRLRRWSEKGVIAPVRAIVPAVTSSVQATYLTGAYPNEHGIVANGWYFRDECEIRFWRQSNKLVQVPKVWELAKRHDPHFTCANLFWWFNMYSTADYSVTVRPMYPADGRKIPDVYTHPPEIRPQIQAEFGRFPLFSFWGPNASIRSSRWIADATKWVVERHDPTLTLVYLPHLDYPLQRLGPNDPALAADLRAIDDVCGDLIEFFEARDRQVVILSEYGITDVSRPIFINRFLREEGLLAVREELGRELLDPGASAAFAVADHQIAHVYVNDPDKTGRVRDILEDAEGIERILDEPGKAAHHLDHRRSGELVAIAEPDAWFAYYYWLDDRKAPDFARTVDIHRKPGYDPVELFTDPNVRFLPLKVGWTLLKKRLGFRYLMDVIPLDPSLVKGSHGRPREEPCAGPLLITGQPHRLNSHELNATDVCRVILDHLHPSD